MSERDTTQAERMDAFGTTDTDELAVICAYYGIKHTMRRNDAGIIIWRCHLPAEFEARLKGKQYIEQWRVAA